MRVHGTLLRRSDRSGRRSRSRRPNRSANVTRNPSARCTSGCAQRLQQSETVAGVAGGAAAVSVSARPSSPIDSQRAWRQHSRLEQRVELAHLVRRPSSRRTAAPPRRHSAARARRRCLCRRAVRITSSNESITTAITRAPAERARSAVGALRPPRRSFAFAPRSSAALPRGLARPSSALIGPPRLLRVSWQSSGTRGRSVGAAVVREVVVHVDRVEAEALQHRDGRRRPRAAVAVHEQRLVGRQACPRSPRFACGAHGARPVRDPPRTRRRCERRARGHARGRAVSRSGPCRSSPSGQAAALPPVVGQRLRRDVASDAIQPDADERADGFVQSRLVHDQVDRRAFGDIRAGDRAELIVEFRRAANRRDGRRRTPHESACPARRCHVGSPGPRDPQCAAAPVTATRAAARDRGGCRVSCGRNTAVVRAVPRE